MSVVTNARKQRVCEANKAILELIWLLGKGLMFKKHLEDYCLHFFNEKPESTWEKVKVLEEAEVIERIRLHNIVVIKLKKFALRFLLQVDREQVRSIEVTASKLMRSAYIHAIVLYHLKNVEIINKLDYQAFMERYYPLATFFVVRNRAYEVLRYSAEKGVLSEAIWEEIELLKEIRKRANSFDTSGKVNTVRFNINSMEQASIFLEFVRKKQGNTVFHIALLDDRNNLTAVKIAEKILKTYAYFYDFVAHTTRFEFTIYVQNEERLKAITSKTAQRNFKNYINNKTKNRSVVYNSQFIEIRYVNLDLDKKLFGSQTLRLISSVNSKNLMMNKSK